MILALLHYIATMKKLLFTGLIVFLTACSKNPPKLKPIVKVPLLPPIENSVDYWLSNPTIALIAAQHNIGADTVMSIVNGFNAMYPVKGSDGVNDYSAIKDHTRPIRPIYIGKGAGDNISRQFFLDQARLYNTNRKEIADIISDVYQRGNRFTPKEL